MARYNTIWAGGDTQLAPQVREAKMSVAGTAGLMVTLNASGEFALAVAASTGAVYALQDQYFVGGGVDTAIPSGSTAAGIALLDQQLINVRIANGVNVAKDAALALGAAGTIVLATAGSRVIGYADEAFNNTTGSAQLVRMRAANTRLAAA